jgi:hypothetical protein
VPELRLLEALYTTSKSLERGLDAGLGSNDPILAYDVLPTWDRGGRDYLTFKTMLYIFTNTPNDITNFFPVTTDNEGHTLNMGDLETNYEVGTVTFASWTRTLNLINHSKEFVNKELKGVSRFRERVDALSHTYTILAGIICAAARITILVLAFTMLHKQDEKLFTNTWARFVPSVS